MIEKQSRATAVSLSNVPFCVTVTPRAQTDPVPGRSHFRVFPSQRSSRSRHNLAHTHTVSLRLQRPPYFAVKDLFLKITNESCVHSRDKRVGILITQNALLKLIIHNSFKFSITKTSLIVFFFLNMMKNNCVDQWWFRRDSKSQVVTILQTF